MLKTDKIPQSVLVNGDNLDELEAFAINWASKLLNVEKNLVPKHPDFFSVRPMNKMRQISVDLIRSVITDIMQSPMQADRKFVLVYEADRMNTAAANAFLKTLEEPPEDTSIFLLSTKPYDLLPTIRSRCWWLNVKSSANNTLINDHDWQIWLKKFKEWLMCCMSTKSTDLIEMYAILHNFQMLFDKCIQNIETPKEDTMSEEELSAAQSRNEKQLCQKFFADIEKEIISISYSPTNKSIIPNIPKLITSLENAYTRIELNLPPTTALESFMMNVY